MSCETETARRYRNRAVQLRSMATSYQNQETGKAVARVAEEYELMARVFDGIDQADLAAIRARNSN